MRMQVHLIFVRVMVIFVLGGALVDPQLSKASFGPGPNEEQIAAERKKLETLRADIGDQAFVTHAISNLMLIAESLPRNHPAFDRRHLQQGTGEHLRSTRPYFAHVSIQMLSDIEDERALPVLAEFMALHQRDAQTKPNASRAMILSWSDYDLAAAAWLHITATNTMTFEQAVIDGLGKGLSSWAIHRVALQMMDANPEHGYPDPFIHVVEPEENLIITLSRMRHWGALEKLAELRAFDVPDDVMQQMLESDRLPDRIGAAIVLYRRDAEPYHWPWGRDVPTEVVEAYREKYERLVVKHHADKAREKIGVIWQELIDRRRALYTEIHQAAWGQKVEKLDHAMLQLIQLTAFTSTDTYFLDHFVNSVGWGGPVPWLERALTREGHELTDQQWQRLIDWLGDPLADDATLDELAMMLINVNHKPAADEIVRHYNNVHVLEDLELHPRHIASQNNRFRAEAIELDPEWLQWLKRNANNYFDE